jgi:hypothetical protein
MSNSKIEPILKKASRSLGKCAKTMTATSSSTPLSANDYETLIGFGIAHDWLQWAGELDTLTYTKAKRGSFERAYGTSELTRFTFMWTAANALFSRGAILKMIDPASSGTGSELERFKVLSKGASLAATDEQAYLKALHSLLSLPMHVQHFPWISVNTPPTLLEVIYFKYTVPHEQTRGLGKKLLQAATTSNYIALDLPTLIYATRNWNIHGVLLSSSFRGTRKKFNLWIDTINLALAKVLEGAAATIQESL